jgi:dolichol-phosphate mannosyltransferase
VNDGADMSIGSRYTKGGGFINWPKDRIIISRGGSLYVQLLTFMPIKDPTAGFICYSSKVLNSFNLDKVQLAGYAFQIEMKYVIWKSGFIIKEVPIMFKDRELGTSKMSMSIVKEAIWGVIRLVFRNTKKYYAKAN